MEAHAGSPGGGGGIVANPKKQRSRVTNGRSQFVETDARGPWARRFGDILVAIINDIGGPEAGLSEGQRQLARRAATIALVCERMEGVAAAGNDIDLDAYGTLTDRLGRAFGRLGLKRQAKTVGSTFGDRQREYHERQLLLEREQRERERAAVAVKAAEAAPAGSTEALAPDTGLS